MAKIDSKTKTKNKNKKAEEKVPENTEKNPVLSKSDVINAMAETSEYTKESIKDVVDEFLEKLKESMLEGNDIQLFGFGKFSVKNTNERNARNPKTGETIVVAASKRVSFKPSADFKKLVKEA